ncbi:MAG TPA: Gfo/Idh/MocA family oxidoreductase [Spirochaetia bacterium]
MAAIRLGVVGPGLIWHNAHKAIVERERKTFEVTAFCGSSAASEERGRAENPGARFFRDYEELARSPLVDCVMVLTPLTLNATVTLAALRAGKDVLVEKPMATTTAECSQIVEEARRSGRRVVVLEQDRYSNEYRTAKEILSSGAIGEIVLWDMLHHFVLGDQGDVSLGYGRTAWRRKGDFPLGTFMDGGIHDIAFLSGLFGAPRKVVARGRKCREGFGEYDSISVMMDYDSGLVGVLNHSGYLLPDGNYFHVRGTRGILRVEPGMAVFHRDGTKREYRLGAESGYEMLWAAVKKILVNGAPLGYELAEAARDIATCEAIGSAIRSGAESTRVG